MAHESQTEFFSYLLKSFPQNFRGTVLDIGSLDINGGPHELFEAATYVGVDLGAGPNVTLVDRGENLGLSSGIFDVTMSSECFEHNPSWQGTLHNMIRMTRPGGLVAFTCATTGRPEHGTSRSDDRGDSAPLAVALGYEYYRNVTPTQVLTVLDGAPLAAQFIVVNRGYSDLMFAALKVPAVADDIRALRRSYEQTRLAFASNRYPGNPVWNAAVTVFGDRGNAVYQQVRSRLPRS